tara:strand:- start:2394 stop:3272 length:879 start_codon:yes stop_codon:yes gene_type:complete
MKKILNINDLNKNDFFEIINTANELKNKNKPVLDGKSIGLIFEKHSTRTRISFQVGIKNLNGSYIDIKFDELNLNRFETFEDTFEIMSRYLDCIVFRTTDHKKLNLAYKYFNKPIINALSDISHPCQAISDIYTLQEQFKRLKDIEIVWMGDINNVLYSLCEACELLENINLNIFTNQDIYNQKKELFSKMNNINFHFKIDDEILRKTDCVMTDVFNSMNDKDNKENILSEFQVNENIMNKTSDETVFMHCLPAKIGSEVTKEVIKGNKSIVLKQAENRLHAQKGILKWLDI